MVNKSQQAYRTITEACKVLHLKPHVLRFWETKFEKLQPMTRGGGRRYYSPSDIELLETIKELLYTRGMTIKAASALLDEHGSDAVLFAREESYIKVDDSSGYKIDRKIDGADNQATIKNRAHDPLDRLKSIQASLDKLEKHARAHIATLDALLQKIKKAAS